ncbi:MAG: S66 peptidase family protein [Bulleidia sp.]|nr:S66 peptidase family protein [Bulleidia sp.]
MIYPSFLKKGSTIGISAPSAGVGDKLESFELSEKRLKAQGWHILETEHVRISDPRGGSAEERGKELTSLFENDAVDAVIAAAGGDFLFECLPFIDWNVLKKHPKWIAGASDPTSILYTLTTKYDIATMYGFNAGSFDAEKLSVYERNALKFLKGDLAKQNSSRMHASVAGFLPEYKGLDTPTEWKCDSASLSADGRCIGGCIDVLKDLIGTRYDDTKAFVRKYKDDGIIWYFDDFSLSAEFLYRTLLQMRYAGWFEGTKAVILGRVLFPSSETGMSYEDAVHLAFTDIPVIREADIGHTEPSFTMINGAMMHLEYRNGKGAVSFTLK